jgi:Protein of unknown function (DUF1493)
VIGADLRDFVASELRLDATKLKETDRLQHDFGLDGRDAAQFLERFAARFEVDMTAFQFEDYFGKESAGCIPLWLVWMVIPPLRPKVKPITLSDLQRSVKAKKWKRPKKVVE